MKTKELRKYIQSKIIDSSSLQRKLFEKKKVILAGGCFDIFHYGHFVFLNKAKQKGDFLVVALESDEFILKKKMRKPVHSQQERAEILASLIFVDLVIKLPFFKSDSDYENLVRLIKPKIVAVSSFDPLISLKQSQVEKVGGRVEIVCGKIKNLSSSSILSYTCS